jgi:periplasmic divalent cation tolerance protein
MPTAYITAPPDAAAELARTLVERRLAACVNRFDVESTYRWDGEVHEDGEVALLVKTSPERYAELAEFVREHHPDDVPCVERFDEDDILAPFARWRDAETT